MLFKRRKYKSIKLFLFSLVWLIVVYGFLVLRFTIGPVEGFCSKKLYDILSAITIVLFLFSFLPYVLYMEFLMPITECSTEPRKRRSECVSRIFQIIGIIAIQGICLLSTILIAVDSGYGREGSYLIQNGKQIIRDVTRFENRLSSFPRLKGSCVSGAIIEEDNWIAESRIVVAPIGIPYNDARNQMKKTFHLYTLVETFYSVGRHYLSMYIIVDSSTQKPVKVKFLTTDVSKFTEAQAREFLEKLAKNGGKE